MDSFGSRMLTEFPEPGQPEVASSPSGKRNLPDW